VLIAFQWRSATGGDDGISAWHRVPLDVGLTTIDILKDPKAFYYFVLAMFAVCAAAFMIEDGTRFIWAAQSLPYQIPSWRAAPLSSEYLRPDKSRRRSSRRCRAEAVGGLDLRTFFEHAEEAVEADGGAPQGREIEIE
jgi:hypothetical protein